MICDRVGKKSTKKDFWVWFGLARKKGKEKQAILKDFFKKVAVLLTKPGKRPIKPTSIFTKVAFCE